MGCKAGISCGGVSHTRGVGVCLPGAVEASVPVGLAFSFSLPAVSLSLLFSCLYLFIPPLSATGASCVPRVCRVLGAQWCLAQILSPPERSEYCNGHTHLLYSKANIFKHLKIVMQTWIFRPRMQTPPAGKLEGGASSPGASPERGRALQVRLRSGGPAAGALGTAAWLTEVFTSGTRGGV